jgi:predicted peroxiredoxin
MRLLVHIATGPENATRVALGMLVARTARAEGHDVDLFFAGDGVDVLRAETREQLQGVGTGSVAEHWAALLETGVRIYGSGQSSKARGISPEEGVELAPPQRLVHLIADADRVVTY